MGEEFLRLSGWRITFWQMAVIFVLTDFNSSGKTITPQFWNWMNQNESSYWTKSDRISKLRSDCLSWPIKVGQDESYRHYWWTDKIGQKKTLLFSRRISKLSCDILNYVSDSHKILISAKTTFPCLNMNPNSNWMWSLNQLLRGFWHLTVAISELTILKISNAIDFHSLFRLFVMITSGMDHPGWFNLWILQFM